MRNHLKGSMLVSMMLAMGAFESPRHRETIEYELPREHQPRKPKAPEKPTPVPAPMNKEPTELDNAKLTAAAQKREKRKLRNLKAINNQGDNHGR